MGYAIETHEVDCALRQGDVLCDATAQSDPHVILTADCDLAHHKNGGRLTCVPLRNPRDYMCDVTMAKKRQSEILRLTAQGIDLEHSARLNVLPSAIPLSVERFVAWSSERFPITDPVDFAKADDPLDQIMSAVALLSADLDFDGSVASLIVSRSIPAPGSKARAAAAIRNTLARELADSIERLPGDALYLTAEQPFSEQGYVAYLRTPVEIRDADVARTYQYGESRRWIRKGRVCSPFLYALTQQFGMVFMSVGLPVDYERARANFAGQLLGEE